MDFHMDTATNLWSLPRGVERNDGVGGQLAWTAKYGSVVAAAYDLMTVDGMNEGGLAAHVLWLSESTYGARDDSRPGLSMAVWMQHFLDNFASVDEAVTWINETGVQVVPLADPATGLVPLCTWRWTMRAGTPRSSSTWTARPSSGTVTTTSS